MRQRGVNQTRARTQVYLSVRRSSYRLYLFRTGSPSSLAIRSEESLLGANLLVSWKASLDWMASATAIDSGDIRIVVLEVSYLKDIELMGASPLSLAYI